MLKLELKKVNKYFDQNLVLKDLSFEVEENEFFVLVGPSGCGKSTILRLIAGLEEVSSGEIYLDGVRVNDFPIKQRDVAMVFQNYALYPHFTVFDNLAFPLKLRGFEKERIKERVVETAELLGLERLLKRKPQALSGGERQRVALGRAIIRKPKIFLLDEPLSNLDAMLRVQMRGELLKLHHKLKTSILYVTHDQTEAMTLGQRVLVLKEGVVQQIGTPLDLYNSPSNTFVASFIGTPGINLIQVKLTSSWELILEEKFVLAFPEKRRKDLKKQLGKELSLGIRAEDVHINLDRAELNLELEQVEPAGGDIFLYFKLGQKKLVVKEKFREDLHPGILLGLSFDLNKALFFEVNTGANLLRS